jgi:hypothetical protein
VCVTIDGVRIGELDLLTTCTHHSELQVITALLLISTIYKSQPAVSPSTSPWQRPPVEISQLQALRTSCHSRLCRTLVNCQLNYCALSSEPHFQRSTELPTLNWLDCPNCLLYNSSARTTSKTPLFYFCVRVRFRGNVFIEPFLRNGSLFIRLLHSNGCTRCLFQGLCLATGLYATVSRSCLKCRLRFRG